MSTCGDVFRTFVAPLLESDGTLIRGPRSKTPICWLDQFLQGGFRKP